MMTMAKFILTTFVIVVATLWGTAQQANASHGFLPWFRIEGQFSAYANWRVRARAPRNNHSLFEA